MSEQVRRTFVGVVVCARVCVCGWVCLPVTPSLTLCVRVVCACGVCVWFNGRD